MSVSSHVLSLKRKYDHVNQLITEELNRPVPDSILLYTLKLKRLRIKEEIHSSR